MGSALLKPWFRTNQNEKNDKDLTKNWNDKNNIIQDLTKEEAKTAEAAKQGALEILQDALKKKDKLLMKVPERVFLKGEEKENFWMERHAILTEDIVEKLIAELKKVTLKKDISRPHTYAYVILTDEQKIIYLCDMFWKAPEYLKKNSQPGILIHELSHFTGAADITYEESTLYVGCKGSLVKGSSENSSPAPKEDYWERALLKAFLNANSIAYEFELTLNHRGRYVGGKYSCCGETKRYSVCESSVPDHFHFSTFDKTWETEILLKELHQRSEAIAAKIFLLALMTFGFSARLQRAGGMLPIPMGRLSVIDTSKARETTTKNKLYPILGQYLRFLDIQKLLKFLDGTEVFGDSKQKYEFYTFLNCILELITIEEGLAKLKSLNIHLESKLGGKCDIINIVGR